MDGGAVVVVLVLGRLLRLRLDQERALEADPVLVLGDHRQEPGELGLLAGEVGVEQRLVALATAPQDVVGTAEPMRRLEHHLHLRRRVGEHLRIRVGGRARGVARVAEQVGRPPQELHPGPGHVLLGLADHHIQVGARLGERPALGCDVAIVEAVERDAELDDELERRIELCPRRGQRLEAGIEPGPVERPGAEDVGSRPIERVPQADRDPEVIRHPLAQHQAIGLVDLERQRLRGIQAPERHRLCELGEEVAHARSSLPVDPCLRPHCQLVRGYHHFVGQEHKKRSRASCPGSLLVRRARRASLGPFCGSLTLVFVR